MSRCDLAMSIPLIEALREHLEGLASSPISDPESMTCTSIEGDADSRGGGFWIQLYRRQVNFLHLDDSDKDELLASILSEIESPVEIDPGMFVTFGLGSLSGAEIDSLLSRLLVEYFGASGQVVARISSEEL
jgi:hypothetical protein